MNKINILFSNLDNFAISKQYDLQIILTGINTLGTADIYQQISTLAQERGIEKNSLLDVYVTFDMSHIYIKDGFLNLNHLLTGILTDILKYSIDYHVTVLGNRENISYLALNRSILRITDATTYEVYTLRIADLNVVQKDEYQTFHIFETVSNTLADAIYGQEDDFCVDYFINTTLSTKFIGGCIYFTPLVTTYSINNLTKEEDYNFASLSDINFDCMLHAAHLSDRYSNVYTLQDSVSQTTPYCDTQISLESCQFILAGTYTANCYKIYKTTCNFELSATFIDFVLKDKILFERLATTEKPLANTSYLCINMSDINDDSKLYFERQTGLHLTLDDIEKFKPSNCIMDCLNLYTLITLCFCAVTAFRRCADSDKYGIRNYYVPVERILTHASCFTKKKQTLTKVVVSFDQYANDDKSISDYIKFLLLETYGSNFNIYSFKKYSNTECKVRTIVFRDIKANPNNPTANPTIDLTNIATIHLSNIVFEDCQINNIIVSDFSHSLCLINTNCNVLHTGRASKPDPNEDSKVDFISIPYCVKTSTLLEAIEDFKKCNCLIQTPFKVSEYYDSWYEDTDGPIGNSSLYDSRNITVITKNSKVTLYSHDRLICSFYPTEQLNLSSSQSSEYIIIGIIANYFITTPTKELVPQLSQYTDIQSWNSNNQIQIIQKPYYPPIPFMEFCNEFYDLIFKLKNNTTCISDPIPLSFGDIYISNLLKS